MSLERLRAAHAQAMALVSMLEIAIEAEAAGAPMVESVADVPDPIRDRRVFARHDGPEGATSAGAVRETAGSSPTV